jgi:hypothetical protein
LFETTRLSIDVTSSPHELRCRVLMMKLVCWSRIGETMLLLFLVEHQWASLNERTSKNACWYE